MFRSADALWCHQIGKTQKRHDEVFDEIIPHCRKIGGHVLRLPWLFPRKT
uniref:Uncharacterized protein n=1 Tax=Anguilla anguilla TaxID=7936 RepID=A0A0E9XE34_ANGAN